MFNNEGYQRRLDELKESIRRGLDEELGPLRQADWAKDVSLRYGRFLARNTVQQLERAVAAFVAYDHVDDKQKHRDYCAAELMGVVAGLHAASAIIRGSVVIADPIGAEAMMRIYEEANGHARSTAPAPMALESDVAYRDRIRPVWGSRDMLKYSQDNLEIANSLQLDELGRHVGVLRTAAPAA